MKDKLTYLLVIGVVVLAALGIYLSQGTQKGANIFFKSKLADLPETVTEPGEYIFELNHGEGLFLAARNTVVYVPQGYDPAKSYPLVMMLHAGGTSALQAIRDTGFNDKADQEGFIVMYPEAWNWVPRNWNAGECCGKASDDGVDDVDFLEQSLNKVKSSINIDDKNVFAAGYSNGGMMAYRMACEKPELFGAVAGVASALATEGRECNMAGDLSVLSIRAKDDPTVAYNGGCGTGGEDETGRNHTCPSGFDHLSAQDNIQIFVDELRCNPGAEKSALTKSVGGRWFKKNASEETYAEIEKYNDCEGGNVVELISTERGGHFWSQETLAGLNAADYIWDFFKSAPTDLTYATE